MAIFIPNVIESCIAISCLAVASAYFRTKEPHEVERRFITPEELHSLITKRKVLLYDIRQPMDLIGESEIITGAKWIDPEAIFSNPSVIPNDQDSVVYCACHADETTMTELRRALAMRFSRMKILRGGLNAWKARGYQTVPYPQSPQFKGGQ